MAVIAAIVMLLLFCFFLPRMMALSEDAGADGINGSAHFARRLTWLIQYPKKKCMFYIRDTEPLLSTVIRALIYSEAFGFWSSASTS
jgi:hypothetical protein